jgi:hypothetical protein
MNPIRTKYNVIALLALAGISACSTALAQPPNEKPKDCVGYQGDLTYTAKISGPHLERIKGVIFHFDHSASKIRQEDIKLRTQFEIGVTPRPGDAPGLFRVSFSVGAEFASGEWTLSMMSINGNGATQSVQGSALSSASFRVCAPEEFGPYKVDSVENKR